MSINLDLKETISMYTYYFEILQSIFIDFHGKIFFKNSLEKRLLFMNIKLFKQFVNNC